ncbi:MAG: plastocyanin/azurin family copper-binding protein [Solirubrobacteraceae bacterium]
MLNRPHLGRRAWAVLMLAAVLASLIATTALASPAKSVKVGDSFFGPKSLSIGKGTSVTWNWSGALLHNVKVRLGPAKFKSPTQIRGTYRHTFSARGTYKLYCTLHPNMTMTVVVH